MQVDASLHHRLAQFLCMLNGHVNALRYVEWAFLKPLGRQLQGTCNKQFCSLHSEIDRLISSCGW